MLQHTFSKVSVIFLNTTEIARDLGTTKNRLVFRLGLVPVQTRFLLSCSGNQFFRTREFQNDPIIFILCPVALV